MKIVFLHGLESTPETSGSAKAIREKFPEILVPDYNPMRPYAEVKEFLTEYINQIDDDVTVIGISMGGFWALHLTEFTNCKKVILLNPAIYKGENYGVAVKIGPEVWGHVILNKDDTLVDNEANYFRFTGRFKVDEFETGGHRMENMDQVLPLIEATLDHYETFIL